VVFSEQKSNVRTFNCALYQIITNNKAFDSHQVEHDAQLEQPGDEIISRRKGYKINTKDVVRHSIEVMS